MRFQYQKPSVMSFREGRQTVSSTLANISARQQKARLAAMEQQRALQVAQQKQLKSDIKARMGKIDGFSFENMTVDGRNNLKSALNWGSENVANMNAQEFGQWLRGVKTMVAQDQEWYNKANDQFDNYIKLMDVGEREKANSKLDGYEYYIDMDDFKMKEGLLESPITRGGQGVQGVFDPSRLGYVNESGFSPITSSMYYPSDKLGPVTRELEYYANITDIYNSQTRGSAKSYRDVMASSKTEDRDPSYYENSAVNAFQDTIWTKKNHLQSLFDQYETENGVLSSGAKNVMLESKNRENAIKIANQVELAESEIEDINNLYNYGIEKTKEWGMQFWKKKAESGGGSGSGGGGSTKERLPKIDSSALVAQEFFRSVDQGNVVAALPLPVPFDPRDFENIAQVGFMAFQSPKKVPNTFEGLTDIQSAELRLKSFAMDSKYQLYTHVEVPRTKQVYTVVGERDVAFDTLQEAQAYARQRYTTVNPQPEEREIYEDEFIVVRPASLINAQGGFTADEWKTSPSMEDNFYRNVLMRIGREMNTALGVTQKGEEETMRDAWKFLIKEYGYE